MARRTNFGYFSPSYAGSANMAESAKIQAENYDKAREGFSLMNRTQAALLQGVDAADTSSADYIKSALGNIKNTMNTLATDDGISYESGLALSRDLADQLTADPTFAAIANNSKKLSEYRALRNKLIAENGEAVELGPRPEGFQTITKDENGKQVINAFDGTPQVKGNYAGVINDIVKSIKPERYEELLRHAELAAEDDYKKIGATDPLLYMSVTKEGLAKERLNKALLDDVTNEYMLKSEGRQQFNVLTSKNYDGLDESTARGRIQDDIRSIFNKYTYSNEARTYQQDAGAMAALRAREEATASPAVVDEGMPLIPTVSTLNTNKKAVGTISKEDLEGKPTAGSGTNYSGIPELDQYGSQEQAVARGKQIRSNANLDTFRKSNPKYANMPVEELRQKYNSIVGKMKSPGNLDADFADVQDMDAISKLATNSSMLDQTGSLDRAHLVDAPNPNGKTLRDQLGMDGDIKFVATGLNFASAAGNMGGGIKGKYTNGKKEVEAIIRPNDEVKGILAPFNDAYQKVISHGPGFTAMRRNELVDLTPQLAGTIDRMIGSKVNGLSQLGVPFKLQLKNKVSDGDVLAPVFSILVDQNGDGSTYVPLYKSKFVRNLGDRDKLRKLFGNELEISLNELRDLTTRAVNGSQTLNTNRSKGEKSN